MPKRLLLPALALIALLLAACGGGEKADIATLATRAAGTEPSTSLSISARDIKFDKDTLVAKADSEVVIRFENRDNGIVHNVAVYTDSSARTAIFKGDLFNGTETREYRFRAPAAGVYYFRCDAHPNMNGAFIAK
ncbi:MAG TPA: cupredoxin domain-containing protein [Dehalococcoidia bacterium]|nr:cupredoxin domain-containing protein [Dehalococcoidia bacterium]